MAKARGRSRGAVARAKVGNEEEGAAHALPGTTGGAPSELRRYMTSTALWGTLVTIAVFVGAVMLDQARLSGGPDGRNDTTQSTVQNTPTSGALTPLAAQGQRVFSQRCAACHGRGAMGSGNGPPLLHRNYGASVFGDEAIVQAIKNGVQGARWGFGPMPAIPGLGGQDLVALVRFIRELQARRGIE
jgi:mono/diheme cytochrome c family protein